MVEQSIDRCSLVFPRSAYYQIWRLFMLIRQPHVAFIHTDCHTNYRSLGYKFRCSFLNIEAQQLFPKLSGDLSDVSSLNKNSSLESPPNCCFTIVNSDSSIFYPPFQCPKCIDDSKCFLFQVPFNILSGFASTIVTVLKIHPNSLFGTLFHIHCFIPLSSGFISHAENAKNKST